jgi:hypothetical protein
MKRLILLFLLFVLISPQARAFEIKDPASIRKLTIDVNLYGKVAVDGSPTWVGINLSIPQDDEWQDVSIDVNMRKDEYGTVFGFIESDDPGNVFSYSILATVESRAEYLDSLPKTYSVPDNVKVYLKATENIQSNDPKIKRIAEEITKDARDDFEKVAKLAIWVHDNLTYDLSYSKKNYDALTVLNNRRGVCSEYTTLFIALARSLGLPARFVSAYAYGEEGWERHAYAEVYLGKWIPVDPLWLEIGYLDATHINFGNYPDNTARNQVQFKGYDVKNIRWVEDETTLNITNYERKEKEEGYELIISGKTFRKGDEGVVLLRFTPKEYLVARIDLEPCIGGYNITSISTKGKKIILRPNEENLVFWKFHVNDNLPKNFLFTCPLTLNSRSFEIKTINVEVDTRFDRREGKNLKANLGSNTVKLGSKQNVFIKVSNVKEPINVSVITPKEYKTWFVDRDQEISFSFVPESLGENEIVVFSSSGEVLELKYRVESELSIYIENFTAPEYLRMKEQGWVRALIVNKGQVEQSLRITKVVDDKEDIETIVLKDAHEISFPLSFETPGSKTIRLIVKDTNVDLSETRIINVYEEPKISYETLYDKNKAIGTIKLDVKNSRIKEVVIKIGDQEREIPEIFGEREIDFRMEKGKYNMRISYKDLSGELHELTEEIEFKEEGILEMIIRILNDFFEQIIRMFKL